MTITSHGRKAASSAGFRKEIVPMYLEDPPGAALYLALVLCANEKGQVRATDEDMLAFVQTNRVELWSILEALVAN